MAPDSQYARLLDLVARLDPPLIDAIADVDRGLIEWGLSLSPWERLRSTSETLRFWSGFRRATPEAS
jgi:hypothetical protein